jgi:non-heme chloroperoxidase
MNHQTVRTPDGVTIAVQQAGPSDGPEIVLIHGFSQCHLSWSHQFNSDLAREFRLVSYDLRGHGDSDKPDTPIAYRDGRLWADELACVLDTLQLRRPVLVAWSYAGRIIADYLDHYGWDRLAGLNLVGSKTRSDPAFVGGANAIHQTRMASADLAENIGGTIGFLRSCAAHWAEDEFATHLAFNMLVPAKVRRWLHGRSFDADNHYANTPVPVLFTHGTEDQVVPVAASQAGHAITRNAQLSLYPGIGHAPFVETPDRFNTELATFVRLCAG